MILLLSNCLKQKKCPYEKGPEVVSKPSIRFKVKAGRGIQTQEYI
jgi:hypothetical protein